VPSIHGQETGEASRLPGSLIRAGGLSADFSRNFVQLAALLSLREESKRDGTRITSRYRAQHSPGSPLTASTTEMKKLSQAMNLVPILVGFLLTLCAVLFLTWVYLEGGGRDREVVPFLLIVAMLPSLVSGILILRVVYKLWSAIQSGSPRTSPGTAIGLLFVPLFNLYWVFEAYWGLAKDYNRFIREKNLLAPVLSEQLAVSVCILILLSLIPVVGFLFFLINIVLQLVFVASLIRCFNSMVALAEAGNP